MRARVFETQVGIPPRMTTNGDFDKPLAVVTGASSGIGYELAKQFARNGYDLLVTSETDAITAAARDFAASGAHVDAVEADLATYEGVEKLYEAIVLSGRAVEAIAINAGVAWAATSVKRTLRPNCDSSISTSSRRFISRSASCPT